MYVPKCFQRKITKQELIKKLKKMYNKDNKESEKLEREKIEIVKPKIKNDCPF